MLKPSVGLLLTFWLFVPASAPPAFGGDWPTWRYDAGRGAVSPEALPESLSLQWVRQLPSPRPAWPASQAKLQFDRSAEPVVLGRRLFVGSTVNDSITAYDTRTGAELWRFYTEGPVRFAPVAGGGRVCAVSDDGYLYALDSKTGSLLWKVNGGPRQRPILGNDRLVSSWPARGGVVMADGVLYFAASIWPSMGIFIHAVEADTGRVLWTNSETGSRFTVHPHGASSFGSIVPQGYLAVAGDYLIVPGGRSLPAVLDRKTGELVHFDFGGKSAGGFSVMAQGDRYLVGGELFRLSDGQSLTRSEAALMSDRELIGVDDDALLFQSLAGVVKVTSSLDRKGRTQRVAKFTPEARRSISLGKNLPETLFCQAGDRLYLGEEGRVAAVDLSKANGKKPLEAVWSASIDQTPLTMLAADDRLFVVTDDARLYCFGAEQRPITRHELESTKLPTKDDEWTTHAKEILNASGAKEGYAIALGIGSGRLIEELVRQTKLHVIAVDNDAEKVLRLRKEMDQAGLYGTRVAALVGEPASFPFPPYVAELIVTEDPALAASLSVGKQLRAVYRAVRPYGGTLVLPLTAIEHANLSHVLHLAQALKAQDSTLTSVKLERLGTWTLVRREGPLPDSALWTHQYGDATNSVVSKDQLVKAPLGVLWFGGPSNDKVLPRHGHGPSPQVAGGRVLIEGPDMLRAVDAYTGRVLWEKDLPGVGEYYDVTRHFSGAGEVGSNYVSLPERIYVIDNHRILELDAVTGDVIKTFELKAGNNQTAPPWGFLAIAGNRLVATSGPVHVPDSVAEKLLDKLPNAKPLSEATDKDRGTAKLTEGLRPADKASSSRRLVVYDRTTGEELWNREAVFSFRHNGIVATEDQIFCIDSLSPTQKQLLERRGINTTGQATLLALNAQTGKELWKVTEDVFGTFLNYSTEHDVLLQAGSAYRDRAADEVGRGMIAYRGKTGEVLWKDLAISYNGPCLLWRDKIITNGSKGFQLNLKTGERTGWEFSRMYGCNTVLGSEHLLTFRSGAAGICDLLGNSGTGNLGGFRSSCTSNLIPADGVLSAPDYTRTCSCAYQNQTSVAWIHEPEVEFWTFSTLDDVDDQTRFGLNLGAPGDRRSDEGTLWYEYPSQGGPSPKLKVQTEPKNPQWFREHASQVSGDGLDWVASSGAEGLRKLTLTVPETLADQATWTVRLHFTEPADAKPSERVFSIALQDQVVEAALDVVREANAPRATLVKEYRGINASKTLTVTLTPLENSTREPVLCGVEIFR